MLRKTLEVLALGILWGIAWAAIFAVLSIVVGIVRPANIDSGEGPLPLGAFGALVGFVSGVVFALVLAWTEQGRPIASLPPWRAAIIGAMASAVFPLLAGMPDQVLVFAPLRAV